MQSIDGIRFSALTKLYLAQNEIENLGRGTQGLVNLQFLHLRGNPLSDLSGFHPNNGKLAYLNIRECRIKEPKELEKLEILKGLVTLILGDNPFNQYWDLEESDQFRIQILGILPHLIRINKKEVTTAERIRARRNLG